MNFKVDVSITETGAAKHYTKYSLESDLDGSMTLAELLEFTKSTLIVTADEILKEELARGFPKDFVTVVDGNKNKAIQAVHPLGKIEFTAKRDISEIVLYTYQGLLDRSPVVTGRYKSSHYVFHNGTQVATDLVSLQAWLKTEPEIKLNDKIRFVNIQPYARRLERLGVRAGQTQARTRTKKDKAGNVKRVYLNQPNGSYFITSRATSAKFKNNARVQFTFITGAQLGIAGNFKTGRPGKNSSGRPYLYPSIIITIGEGVTNV